MAWLLWRLAQTAGTCSWGPKTKAPTLEITTRKEILRFEGHTSWVTSVGFSPHGRQVLTGSWDGTIRLWDAETGEQICTFYVLRDGGWITLTPQAFIYDGSETTRELLLNHLTVVDSQGNRRQLTQEEFARLHRPDLVAQILQQALANP